MSANQELANTFAEILEDLGYEPYAYSGRGMYGKRCVAINLSRDQSVWELAASVCQRDDNLVLDVGAPQQDNMGLDIVVYWPRLPYEAAAPTENEDEE